MRRSGTGTVRTGLTIALFATQSEHLFEVAQTGEVFDATRKLLRSQVLIWHFVH